MYETVFSLNTVFTDLQNLHGSVKRVLTEQEDDPREYQYRALTKNGATIVIARSHKTINETSINWTKVDDNFEVGDVVAIRLLANVVRQHKGKKFPVYGDDAKRCFQERLERSGLSIDNISYAENSVSTVKKRTAKKVLHINEQEISALCTVKDKDLFASAYKNGVGRAKHLGYGMLIVSRKSA